MEPIPPPVQCRPVAAARRFVPLWRLRFPALLIISRSPWRPRAPPPGSRRRAGAAGRFPSRRKYVITSRRRRRGPAIMVHLGGGLLRGHYRGGHVVIRFALGGCTNRPFYRIVAAHSKRARDGKYLEQLGCIDPLPNAHGEKVAGLNLERLRHWLGCGAQLTRPAEKLLGLAGFLPLHPMTVTNAERIRRRQRRAQGSIAPPADGGAQEPGTAQPPSEQVDSQLDPQQR
ncbi:28S ribosomal protein S16, mitochondrial isoform X2 [Coturnix japonica]|uniref:28S ribosomal protein S16, mitochondrial isoform X2 n=2 Tax=Coturnix japonica TaxID=93934 RepID=UPI0007774D48|nr:28S ribosomal protein S16, mitochondrial isoform X2 [Coturnix japonica]